MLLLHGLGGSRISWEPQLTGLSDEFRVAAWDMPGYGHSAPLSGATTFASLAGAVERWADALAVERFHLVGLSMGGMIAQYVAASLPARVESLTLLSTSPKFGLDGTTPEAWRAARLAPLDAGQTPADFASTVLRSIAGPHISDRALAGQVAAMGRITSDGLRRSIDCLITHDSRSILPLIEASTVIGVGALDSETPVAYGQALVDGIPRARLQVIDGAGHLLNVEAPEAVNALIRAHANSRSLRS